MELLETTAQSHEIEKIINESNEYLIIVSPYLQINNRLRPKFDECFNRNGKILILYRENQLTSFELDWFDCYKNVTLMPIKNLHAKCYLNEKTALITSMNLYDYSQINNHEIGVKLTSNNNKDQYDKLLSFVNTILKTDYPQQTLSYYTNYTKELTMGKLYAELLNEYTFSEKETRGVDGIYIFMSSIAQKLYNFDKNDFKQDSSVLLRATKLNENLYAQLKEDLIRRSLTTSSDEEKEYDYQDFISSWHKHLVDTFNDKEFSVESDIIVAKDFPTKNVDFSNRYGFASFSFNFDYEYMGKVRALKDLEFLKKFKDYRLYWNPSNKINIYSAKNLKFKNVHEHVKYSAEGLNKIIEEIKKFS